MMLTSKSVLLNRQQPFVSRSNGQKGRFAIRTLALSQDRTFGSIASNSRRQLTKLVAPSWFLAAVMMALSPMSAHSSENVALLFQNTCAGCHAGGGNIVRRDATLVYGDLQKFSVTSPEQLYDLIYNGRGSMPGYGEKCSPKLACTFAKRLSDNEINELSLFVLDKATNGWQ